MIDMVNFVNTYFLFFNEQEQKILLKTVRYCNTKFFMGDLAEAIENSQAKNIKEVIEYLKSNTKWEIPQTFIDNMENVL